MSSFVLRAARRPIPCGQDGRSAAQRYFRGLTMRVKPHVSQRKRSDLYFPDKNLKMLAVKAYTISPTPEPIP